MLLVSPFVTVEAVVGGLVVAGAAGGGCNRRRMIANGSSLI